MQLVTYLVSVTLTGDQAELVAAAMRDATNNEDITLDESKTIYDTGMLFQDASENPSKYPLSPKMAATLRPFVRKAKGAAQPQSRTNKRKARQEKRQGWSKMRRKNRAAMVKGYNEAVAIQEAEAAEIEAIHAEAIEKLKLEPKFNIMTYSGEIAISDVPESMIVAVKAELDVDSIAEDAASEIILP